MSKSIFDDDELAKYDHPIEDDDDDDDDIDEGLDWTKEDDEVKSETQKNMAQQFNGVFQGSSPWGQPAFGQPAAPTWGTTQQYSPWGQPKPQPFSPWTGGWSPAGTAATAPAPTTGQQYVIPRGKRVVFTDLLDVLIGSIDGQGKLGVPPRGTYDVFLRRDIIERLRVISPQYLYILTNQGLQEGTESLERFLRMTKWVTACISEILGLPLENVKCILSTSIDPTDPRVKPGTGLIEVALKELKPLGIVESDCIVIGSRSGFQYQSNLDAVMASKAGIDYLDSQQLINLYK